MKKEIHYVTADEAVKVVKSGDHVHLSSVASAPRLLIEALCRRGEAGELRGDFDLTGDLGGLYANTASGVFGTLEEPGALAAGEAVPVGRAEPGPAVIRSNVRGDAVEEFEIQIAAVTEGAADGRDMVLTVTDPELLALTGGIVQGMSGSPILQNGKLVGAVTHVLLNSPDRGYGVSIQRMLDTAETARG